MEIDAFASMAMTPQVGLDDCFAIWIMESLVALSSFEPFLIAAAIFPATKALIIASPVPLL
jgi:hypothetical protein